MKKKDESQSLSSADPVRVSDPATKNMVEMIEKGKFEDAIDWIKKKAKEEEQLVHTSFIFDAYPVDGAVAFFDVLRLKYGWVEQIPPRNFWGTLQPPALVSVETAHGIRDVPWGEVAVPNIEGSFYVTSAQKDSMWKFQLVAKVKKKHVRLAADLIELTKERIRSHSIYKGQCLSLKWEEEEGNFFTQGSEGFGVPRFLVPSGLEKKDLILPELIAQEVNATIFSLIENSEKARAMGIPTKRLTLLAGPYGVGKTLTASVTADICRVKARTFAYLRDMAHLADAVYFMQAYAPACVFGEDIDAVDEATMDHIANTIDAVDTKNIDMIFILTTNHPDRIPEKFLRAGRSDMVIRFTPPDGEAAARLILRYGGGTLEATFNEALRIGEELAAVAMIPASIREVVERSKLFALARGVDKITAEDLGRAAHSVIGQLDLLRRAPAQSLPEHLEEVAMMVRHKNGDQFISR